MTLTKKNKPKKYLWGEKKIENKQVTKMEKGKKKKGKIELVFKYYL